MELKSSTDDATAVAVFRGKMTAAGFINTHHSDAYYETDNHEKSRILHDQDSVSVYRHHSDSITPDMNFYDVMALEPGYNPGEMSPNEKYSREHQREFFVSQTNDRGAVSKRSVKQLRKYLPGSNNTITRLGSDLQRGFAQTRQAQSFSHTNGDVTYFVEFKLSGHSVGDVVSRTRVRENSIKYTTDIRLREDEPVYILLNNEWKYALVNKREKRKSPPNNFMYWFTIDVNGFGNPKRDGIVKWKDDKCTTRIRVIYP